MMDDGGDGEKPHFDIRIVPFIFDGNNNNNNMTMLESIQENKPLQSEIVELATLVLPPAAMENGLEAGGGDQVILEASPQTVEQLNLEEQPSQISAVVDLERLSALIGVSEQEFIAGLYEDLHDQRESAAQQSMDLTQADGIVGEQRPLLSDSISVDRPSETKISLPADPFIESLADVLAAVEGEEREDAFTEAAATTTEADQHLAHDAFLLDIPSTGENGKIEHHYVLALPEIQVDPSIATSVVSDATMPFLERALSILPTTTRLPTDVEAVHLEATTTAATKTELSDVHLDIVVERRVPVIGYVILFSGLFALASVGAALDLQKGGVSPTMKTIWRQMSTCVSLLPLVIKSLRQDGIPKLSRSQLALLPICAASYAYMTLAFVISLEMTTMANAFVLSNMTSLVIIAARFCVGLPILPAEGWGALTGFVGAAICADDATRTMTAMPTVEGNYAMLGNVLALSASFGTALYLIIAKQLRSSVDLFLFMFIIMVMGVTLLLMYLPLSGEFMTFDRHPAHGVFGWINFQADRLPLELYMAIVCNCLGTTGYIAVMKYFEPIVPATVMLLEPVIGALLGTAAGIAPLPGLMTWVGDVVVAVGTFCVIASGARKTEKIDASDALRARDATRDDTPNGLKSPMIRRSPYTRRPDANARAAAESPARVIWDH